jgi:aryl-alcohol dehydrogenase-like predicted oxidoreductase
MPDDPNPHTQKLPVRPLGETGESVTILGLGGAHLARLHSAHEAHELVDVALDEGIRFFDTAESYHNGTSEQWLGAALGSRRADVFLMSKTFDFPERSTEGAKWHLEGSLARLDTDRLDLWQLHSVRSVADVDRAFGKGGAMEFILEMQMKRVVRFTGVTGHKDPEANLRALHYWDRGMRFDAMQMPINPIDHHQRSFQQRVLPELVRRNIGVIAMKTSADGALPREAVCSHAECHRYAWGLPVSVAVVGMEHPELIRENARVARSAPMSPSERETLLARVAPSVALDLEYYKRD